MDTLPDRQVARIALMLLKHGQRNDIVGIAHCKRWKFAGWTLWATNKYILLYTIDWSIKENINPRSQLGLAIRKS